MNRALVVCGAAAAACVLGGCAGAIARPVHAATERGVSTEGRAITVRLLGDAGPSVLVIGGIHGSEPEGLAPVLALVRRLEEEPMRARMVIVQDLNPDGSEAHSRYNARGVDLNRNWPASGFRPSPTNGPKALSEIETRLGDDLIRRVKPELVIVLHSIQTGPFVNYDGPAGDLAQVFAAAADRADHRYRWDVKVEMGYETPGSIGSYLGVDRGIAVLTIEFDRGHPEANATAALIAGVEAVVSEMVHGNESGRAIPEPAR